MTDRLGWKSALISSMLFVSQATNLASLVITAPRIHIDSVANKPVQHVESPTPLSLLVRSTKEDDLNDIASLLASATVNIDESRRNWKISMNVNRNKAAFYTLLSHRFQAVQEGKKAAAKLVSEDALLSETDRIRLLWSHDSFRRKLEKAVNMAKEPHIWKQHNFRYCPNNPNSLRHAMITAEDSNTGDVVGFCEVSMMADCTFTAYAPTIANLATCSKYRRRGIASALLKSAKRYVHFQWSHDEITLYVENENKGAIALYSKQGFRPKGFDSSEKDGKLYMTQSLLTNAYTIA
jgi:ribosomal protein S18 acetylase RimI-like enzyme